MFIDMHRARAHAVPDRLASRIGRNWRAAVGIDLGSFVAGDVLTDEGINEMKKHTMLKHRAPAGAPVDERYEELKQMLTSRQRELMTEVHGRIRSVRDDGSQHDHARLNPGETPDVDPQDGLEFALIQMKAETAKKITNALVRLEQGSYGLCVECGEEIAQPRLRALPFAVRCKDCEEAVEMAQERDRARSRRVASPLGFEMHD